ncbi:MAG: hypothetical protein LBH93_08680 [Chitinispirillales bacterium]|nr:hypothetical protein [Chitinispirillales bacterium]
MGYHSDGAKEIIKEAKKDAENKAKRTKKAEEEIEKMNGNITQMRHLRMVLLVLAILGIMQAYAGRPMPTLINEGIVFVQTEGEKLIVKIQTRSNPNRYTSHIVIDIEGGAYITTYVSKQYIHDGMFVLEIDIPRIAYHLLRFYRISITLKPRWSSRYEKYCYNSYKPICLKNPYFSHHSIVYVESEAVIIKIQPRFKLEWYDKNIVGVKFIDRFSGQDAYLRRTDVSKQYILDGMFVVEVDKSMLALKLAGFTDIEVTLDNGEMDRYTYTSEELIPLIEESTD